jgi:general L-amino acid transport system permease protein
VATIQNADSQARPPLWRDERILRIVGQVVAVVAVVLLLRWLIGNLLNNLNAQNISTDFDFLSQPTNFSIRDANFDPRSSIWPDMIMVGVRNTALSAMVGIFFAMIIGTLVGIGRLSSNWLVAKLSALYVEVIRNIPPLVIIIFFGFAVFTFGPFPAMNPTSPPWEWKLPGSDNNFAILSNDRWGIPAFANTARGSLGLFWLLLLIGLIAAVVMWVWRTRVNINTGQPHHRVILSFLTLVGVGVVAYFVTGRPFGMSWPAVSESGRVIEGGFATNSGYLALTAALALYTASHIAEIIRGSILAVPNGQSEAANALALSGFQRYRFVILPQAMRIAIPALINQFLNLTKNTSLATAVAYADITALTQTAIGNGKPAVQMLVILMSIYLLFSLFWSVILNVVNRRFQLAGR